MTGWNPRAEQMFGWSTGEALGCTFQELVLTPGRQQEHRQRLADVLAGAAPGEPLRTADGFARRKDGSRIPIEVAMWESWYEGRQCVRAHLGAAHHPTAGRGAPDP